MMQIYLVRSMSCYNRKYSYVGTLIFKTQYIATVLA